MTEELDTTFGELVGYRGQGSVSRYRRIVNPKDLGHLRLEMKHRPVTGS